MIEDAMTIKKTLGAVLAGAAVATLSGVAAQAAPAQKSCFYTSEWRGWSSPDPSVLYLRVGVNDVYRVDLQGNRTRLKTPGRFLVNRVRGPSTVCSALDLNLAISDEHGFSTPLFPKSLTKLSREEVQAIPRQYRP